MWEKAEQGLQKMGGHLGKGWEDAALGSRDTPWYPGVGDRASHALMGGNL